eukprot:jgi/Ulvmu1/435/UM001_0442.1
MLIETARPGATFAPSQQRACWIVADSRDALRVIPRLNKYIGMATDYGSQVRELKRKHREQAILSGNPEDTGIFWDKKVERDLKQHKAVQLDDASLRREREAELERVRARRAQNEAEFARRQEEIGDLERQRLAAEALKEAAKEEQFYLKQNIDRARKRLDEERAHAIDLLVQIVHLQRTHPLHESNLQPHTIFAGSRAEEIRPLMEEIELFQALDVEPQEHKQFWDNVMILLKMQLDDQLALAAGQAPEAESGAVKGPAADLVEQALQGSLEDLRALQEQVQAEADDSSCVDPNYWRAVSHKLKRRMAQRALQDICAQHEADARAASARDAVATGEILAEVGAAAAEAAAESDSEEAALPAWMEQSDGRFSPPLEDEAAVRGTVVAEEDDREALLLQRKQAQQAAEEAAAVAPAEVAPSTVAAAVVASARAAPGGEGPGEGAMAQAMAAMGDSRDELNFRGVVPLEAREYWWREKYTPRQPKFFNKVHTGYDWNKYNRAHYDVDNPPPKVVQGYKFNIFYPDLVDKAQGPSYKVLPDPSGDDSTAILKFTAGPPYEDIAFRIVNKEWDRAPKKGFKNVFDRGMLQLYFNFRRISYRR